MVRITKSRAIERLQNLVDEASELDPEDVSSQKFKKWTEKAYSAVFHIFGEDSRQYSRLPGGHSLTPRGIREYFDSMISHVESSLDDVKYFWEDDELSSRNALDSTVMASNVSGDSPPSNRVFVIHGHDEGARDAVARFLERLGLEPIILHEKSSGGRTIIEKFEQNADVGFALALLTPDDMGSPQGEEDDLKPRARQNVIFEFGFFIGRLGRERVCALPKGDVEFPSDYKGVLYIPLDVDGGWKLKLMKELKEAGLEIDSEKAVSA